MNNRDLKSSIITFYSSVFEDVNSFLSSYDHWSSDKEYVLKRISSEGEKFVAHALPLLGKAVDTSLITLRPLIVPQGFNLYGKTRLPVFLHDLISQGWDPNGNPLYDVRDWKSEKIKAFSHSYQAIRQICLAYSKAEDLGCLMVEDEARESFLHRIQERCSPTVSTSVLCRAREILRDLLMDGDRLHASLAQWAEMPFGRHGPGAVSNREKGPDKWRFHHIPGVPDQLFSWSGTESVKGVQPAVARLCLVPKDFKSLRAICIEPKELMFAQQGLMKVLVDIVHHDSVAKRSIAFNDQTPNQRLCAFSNVATIDLKDASDTVRKNLCRLLFPRSFWQLVSRYCSRGVLIDGTVIKPTTVATMGNALCFPIETLVFWSLTKATCDINGYRGPIRVFGDDIICPQRGYEKVTETLTRCGFTVNASKSCCLSIVRESCGTFSVAGNDVSITRLKNARVSSLAAWYGNVEAAKVLYLRGYESTSRAILDLCDTFRPVPYGWNGVPAFKDSHCKTRYNKALQRVEIRVPLPCVRAVGRALPGYTGMYAWIVGNDAHPSYHGTEKVKDKWVFAIRFGES